MKSLRQLGSCLPVILLVGFLTGCVCTANKNAGVPFITCQPVDIEVYLVNGPSQNVTFEVKVDDGNCRFEWYRVNPIKDGFAELSQKSKPGGNTSILTLNNVSEADAGQYFCTIVHETGNELGDVTSRTRLAELRVYPVKSSAKEYSTPKPTFFALTNLGGGIYQLSSRQLTGAASGSVSCQPPSYVASLTFTKDDQGQYFASGTYNRCEAHVTQILNGVATPLLNTKFAARWNTSGGFNGCLTDKAGTTDAKEFTVVKSGKNHTFVIYFVDPQPTGTTNQLRVDWYP